VGTERGSGALAPDEQPALELGALDRVHRSDGVVDQLLGRERFERAAPPTR
jgi:hypothetical protein